MSSPCAAEVDRFRVKQAKAVGIRRTLAQVRSPAKLGCQKRLGTASRTTRGWTSPRAMTVGTTCARSALAWPSGRIVTVAPDDSITTILVARPDRRIRRRRLDQIISRYALQPSVAVAAIAVARSADRRPLFPGDRLISRKAAEGGE